MLWLLTAINFSCEPCLARLRVLRLTFYAGLVERTANTIIMTLGALTHSLERGATFNVSVISHSPAKAMPPLLSKTLCMYLVGEAWMERILVTLLPSRYPVRSDYVVLVVYIESR